MISEEGAQLKLLLARSLPELLRFLLIYHREECGRSSF
jgi:hypothetical protein